MVGGVQLAKEGRYDEAIAMYKKALEIDPTCADALVARGAAFANVVGVVMNFQDGTKIKFL